MKRKVLVLTSGGLDSILALKIMEREGLEPVAVHFCTWFNLPKYVLQKDLKDEDEFFGFPLFNIDLSDEYTPLLLKPTYGFGSGANPCIDCKILFFKKAKELLGIYEADFVASGEVVGQRPMSQMKKTLRLIEKASGLEGYLLRPLSARILDSTIPEQKGWVDTKHLYAISGRGRKEQMALAEQFGIDEYPLPAGGCVLTEKVFRLRMNDLLAHDPVPAVCDFFILRYGRHFRLSGGCKLVVGRNEVENEFLQRTGWGNTVIDGTDVPGPYCLMQWDGRFGSFREGLGIAYRYSDLGHADPGRQEETTARFLVAVDGGKKIIFTRRSATMRLIDETIIR
jgi:tRNA-specific 2-thiouridylase